MLELSRGALALSVAVTLSVVSVDAAKAIEVEVTHLAQSGKESPVVGVEVSLETWKTVPGPDAKQELDQLMNAPTDLNGQVKFNAPRTGSTLKSAVVVRYNGVVYRQPVAEPLKNPRIPIRLYDSTSDLKGLTGVLTIGLDVRDAFLLVEATLKLSNDGSQVVDTRLGEQGLRLPIALPAVGGEPLEVGVIDPVTGPRHVATRASPEGGRFQFQRGAVYFEGAVLPGIPLTLQARYAMPIVDERQDIALSSPVQIERFLVSTSWNDRVAPRVVPDRSFIALGRDPGEQVQRFMRLETPPDAGEAVVIRVDRLPVPLAVFTRVALWGGVALGLLFLFSLVALRERG